MSPRKALTQPVAVPVWLAVLWVIHALVVVGVASYGRDAQHKAVLVRLDALEESHLEQARLMCRGLYEAGVQWQRDYVAERWVRTPNWDRSKP